MYKKDPLYEDEFINTESNEVATLRELANEINHKLSYCSHRIRSLEKTLKELGLNFPFELKIKSEEADWFLVWDKYRQSKDHKAFRIMIIMRDKEGNETYYNPLIESPIKLRLECFAFLEVFIKGFEANMYQWIAKNDIQNV